MSDEERDRPDRPADGKEPEAPAAKPEAKAPAPPEGKPAAPEAPPAKAAAPPGDEPAAPAVPAPPAADEDEAAVKAAAAAKAKAAAEARAKAAKAKAAAEAALDPWQRNPETPEWQEADDDPLARALTESFGDRLRSARTYAGDLTLEIEPGAIAEVAGELKTRHRFTYLVDLCGAHYPDREEAPFEVVYMLHAFEPQRRVRLKVGAAEGVEIPTVSTVWRVADWLEREVYDMYGVRFAGHPDMTRILLWEGFNGHPLRKEFPVEGIDTGSAIYPEYYTPEAGPVAGTGTGWKPPEPPAPEPEPADEPAAGEEPS